VRRVGLLTTRSSQTRAAAMRATTSTRFETTTQIAKLTHPMINAAVIVLPQNAATNRNELGETTVNKTRRCRPSDPEKSTA
jgi:hypothetical protein